MNSCTKEAQAFTPGPWKVRQSRADLTYTHIFSATNENIACTKSEDDANLIATAPELLDAVQVALDEFANGSFNAARRAHAVEFIRAVQRKACGIPDSNPTRNL